MKLKNRYYAIRFKGEVRYSMKKSDIDGACLFLFGFIDRSMEYCFLSSHKRDVKNKLYRKRRTEIQANWGPIPFINTQTESKRSP